MARTELLTTQQRFAKQKVKEEQIADLYTQLILDVQKTRKQNSRYVSTTEFISNAPLPQMLVHESDTHYGHAAADHESWEEQYQYVMNTPGVSIGFYGDILEGFNPNHIDGIHQIILEPTEQILSFHDKYLRKLAATNKVVHMIGWYTNSHLRAATKLAGIDTYPLLTHGLPIDLLFNGSRFIYSRVATTAPYKKHSVAFRGYHNPPSGGRSTNPTAGLDKAEKEASGYADHIVSGHLHTLGNAVSATKTKEGKIQYRYALGARKGRNTGIASPDLFAVSTNGGKVSGPAGAATIFYESQNGEREYGIGDMELARMLFRATNLYTKILSRGQESELRSRIQEELEYKPKLETQENKSKKRIEDLDDQEKKGVVSWKKLTYGVSTELPLLFMFASGLRLDSQLADKKQLREVVSLVSNNPHAYLFALRQMIDEDVPQHVNRQKVLTELVKLVQPLWSGEGLNSKILGWLFDGIMRYEYWKDPKIQLASGGYADPDGFMPANFISEKTGASLVDGEADVIFSFTKNSSRKRNLDYRLKLFDTAGSPRSSFSGMLNNEMISSLGVEGEEHDLLVGNNATTGGWLQKSHPKTDGFQTVISPGWMAHEHTVGNKRTRGVPSPGGYGAILLPDIKKIIPISDPDEATYWYNAMYFLTALPKIASMKNILQELDATTAHSQK